MSQFLTEEISTNTIFYIPLIKMLSLDKRSRIKLKLGLAPYEGRFPTIC